MKYMNANSNQNINAKNKCSNILWWIIINCGLEYEREGESTDVLTVCMDTFEQYVHAV